jgi:3-keto steroid reductase
MPLGEEKSSLYASCDGITLTMACRSIKRAETARLELLKSLDAYVAVVKTRPDYDGHAERFRKSVDIVVMRLDLADLSTVFSFADELMSKYVLYLVGFALL